MEVLAQGRYCLWHIPSGPLPLFRGAKEKPGEIANPFTGWSEVKAGANPSEPYFGAGHPGLFWLNINVIGTPREGTPVVGLSSFEWIGNHYKMIGSPAPHATELFWKSLQRWVKKTATKVARGGPAARTAPEIWALPGAQALFESGAKGGNI
jgi:hypothetical protein